MEGASAKGPSSSADMHRGGKAGIVALALSVLLVLAALALVAGGVYLFWYGGASKDRDGYVVSRDNALPPMDTRAVVVDLVEIKMEKRLPSIIRSLPRRDVVLVRLMATTNSSKELFVGVADETDAMAYLAEVDYLTAVNYYWRVSPRNVTLLVADAVPNPGGAPSEPPTAAAFWIASGRGSPTAAMEWAPQSGLYWIVIMNADGSPGIQTTLQLGAKFPILRWLPGALLACGAGLLILGFLVLRFGYLGKRGRQPSDG